MNKYDKTIRAWAGAAMISLMMTTVGLLFSATSVSAQCTALTSGICQNESTVPQDYSFNPTSEYWTVVGVTPTAGDDKDITVYPACASGTPLASSVGTSGTDFVVGDFNHNPKTTYYAQAHYGPASGYDVVWQGGNNLMPVGPYVSGSVGGTGAGCEMIKVWDVRLEAGVDYRFFFSGGSEARMALFRNPGVGAYWAGRAASEWEISGFTTQVYGAPATDWYGVVVFAETRIATPEFYTLQVERLDDCITLTPENCDSYHVYALDYVTENDFKLTQPDPYWTVVGLLPDTTDDKSLDMYTQCDESGIHLGGSYFGGPGEVDFMVGDFNHNTVGDYYARARDGVADLDFTLAWDSGPDICPVPGRVIGLMDSLDADCDMVKVWDVFLEAGKEYEFFFYEWGPHDPHMALFRNPGTGDYWGQRADAEFHQHNQGYYYYTAPQTDWYGLVVYANKRRLGESLYQVDVQEMNDCVPLVSDQCESHVIYRKDFVWGQTNPYWSVVGFTVPPSENKSMVLYTLCDAKGTLLEIANGSHPGFIVGDFNHNTLGPHYPIVYGGDPEEPFTVVVDNGADILPHNTLVNGEVGGTTGECRLLEIWDVFLEAGKTYNFTFYNSPLGRIGMSLYRNPGSGAYWSDDYNNEWEVLQNTVERYTAPATDWYGLVVFAIERELPGYYAIYLEEDAVTGITTEDPVPDHFALGQNVPNPFNPTTLIAYDVPAGGGHVSIAIYDAAGRLIRSLVDERQTAGMKQAWWDGADQNGSSVSSGVYFYRMTAPGFVQTRKMVLLR